MKKLNKNLKLAILFALIFVVLLVAFSITSSLIQNGIIENIVVPKVLEGLIAFLMFLPLFCALFFLSRFFGDKNIIVASKILKFVSIALFIYGILMSILSLIFRFSCCFFKLMFAPD